MVFFGLHTDEGLVVGEADVNRTSFTKICHTYPTMMKLSAVIPYTKFFFNFS